MLSFNAIIIIQLYLGSTEYRLLETQSTAMPSMLPEVPVYKVCVVVDLLTSISPWIRSLLFSLQYNVFCRKWNASPRNCHAECGALMWRTVTFPLGIHSLGSPSIPTILAFPFTKGFIDHTRLVSCRTETEY